MKKIWKNSMIVCALAGVLLTGCGDGDLFSGADAGEENPLLIGMQEYPQSEMPAEIQTYELKYSSGEFDLEDYRALAGLYEEQGMIRRQRDLLEQAYRLYMDEEVFQKLQTIAVNLAEEDAAVQRDVQTMLQNLEIEEYYGEAIHLIESSAWFEQMMPKLSEGVRNYFLLREGQQVLTIQAGYHDGDPFCDVWYHADGQAIVLSWSGSGVKMLFAGLTEEGYEGDFTLWSLNGATGDIRQEQGTMSGGICTGAYHVRLHSGETGGDVYDLWCNRENMEYQSYEGEFDGLGVTVLEQPAEAKIAALVKESAYQTCLVYAYDEEKTSCLFVGLEQAGQEYVFSAESMGLAARPNFPVYETAGGGGRPEESGAPEAPLQIRIYDGEIQYLSGSTWIALGSVLQYQKEDPFRVYADNKAQKDAERRGQTGENGDGAGYLADNFGVGSVTADSSAAPSTVQKPATTSPTNPKPAVTPPAAPQNPAPATPAPEEPSWEDDDDDDDGGSDDNGSGGDSGNGNSGGGDNPSPGGADVDVEWTPDML